MQTFESYRCEGWKNFLVLERSHGFSKLIHLNDPVFEMKFHVKSMDLFNYIGKLCPTLYKFSLMSFISNDAEVAVVDRSPLSLPWSLS